MGKGSRREREAVDLLERAGFRCYRPATVQYGENDVFGLFDVIALNPDRTGTWGIQVKSNGARGINKWQDDTRRFRDVGWVTYYLIPYDGEGWRLVWCSPSGGRKDVYDGRGSDENMGDGLVSYLSGDS